MKTTRTIGLPTGNGTFRFLTPDAAVREALAHVSAGHGVPEWFAWQQEEAIRALCAEVRPDEVSRIQEAAIRSEPDLATLLDEERAAKRQEYAWEALREARKALYGDECA
jgi:hypothetical protein